MLPQFSQICILSVNALILMNISVFPIVYRSCFFAATDKYTDRLVIFKTIVLEKLFVCKKGGFVLFFCANHRDFVTQNNNL